MSEQTSAPKELNPEQQRVVDELILMQSQSRNKDGLPKSDNDFGRVLGFSGSQWNLIKSGEYWKTIKGVPKKIEELRRALSRIKSTNQLSERFKGKTFHPFNPFQAVFEAVDECLKKPLDDTARCIFFLAPPGGGKSFLGHEVCKRFDGVGTMARKGWSKSNFVALKDMCAAFALPHEKICSPSGMEDLLAAEFRSRENPVCFIDEGEYFGKDILDSVKLFLNTTRSVFVVGVIPEFYDEWNRLWPLESAQIRRRTHAVIEHKQIDAAMAAKILEQELPKLSAVGREKAAALIVPMANQFGAFGLVTAVANQLKDEPNITDQVFENAVNSVLASMGQARLGTKLDSGRKAK